MHVAPGAGRRFLMENISSAAWVAHDLGLAASIGGTLFGRTALMPALYKITVPEQRDFVSAAAWRRFSRINLLSHVAFAATWLAGRNLRGRRHLSRRARPLVHAKDVLVGTSLIT